MMHQSRTHAKRMLSGLFAMSVLATTSTGVAQDGASKPLKTTKADNRNKSGASIPKASEMLGLPPAPDRRLSPAAAEAMARERLARYRGIKVEPHREASGAELAHQKAIATRLELNDRPPAERVRCLGVSPGKEGLTVVGWHGTIQSVEATDRGDLVKVIVSPIIESLISTVHHSSARSTESYLFKPDSIQYLGSVFDYGPLGIPFIVGH